MKLALPSGETLTIAKAASLGQVAAETLGSDEQAELIFDLNENDLPSPTDCRPAPN